MTAVRFPNGQRAARDALREALAARPEPEARGVTVSTKVPPGSPPSVPYVLVRQDDAGRDAALNGYAVVRVTVWHRDEGLALDLAALAEAVLLDAHTDRIRTVNPGSGPVPTTDPDTGDALAFFRVTVRLAPITL